MNLMIKAFGAENLYGAKPEEGTDRNAGKKHIFGGNLHLADDPVEQRRKEAREQAWDIVKNAWDNDNSVDKMIDDRKGHYADMMEQMGEATKKLSEVHKERKALEEQYGKDSTAKEYTDRLWELNAKEETWQTKVWKIQKEMRADMAGVRGIQQERLKSAPMQEAQEASEQIMENANEEIIGTLISESKEHIDEKQEEMKEEAKEAMEEKEEREEALEERRLERAMQEALVDETGEAARKVRAQRQKLSAPKMDIAEITELTQSGSVADEVGQSLDEIKNEMKLLEADLKGIKVDEQV